MSHPAPPKPFKSYAELVDLLISRGMQVDDPERAQRKLAQVGYYRLSGFWYVCRSLSRNGQGQVSPVNGQPVRAEQFLPGTTFEAVLDLYLFDKRLRQLMLDALERIEVHVRSVVAHEVGFHNALAYQDSSFINPSQTRNFVDRRTGRQRNAWSEWLLRQNDQISRIWNQTTGNPLPVLQNDYFQALRLGPEACTRLYGLIAVIWFLVRTIGPNSRWIHDVAELIATKPHLPGCSFAAMGLSDTDGLANFFL